MNKLILKLKSERDKQTLMGMNEPHDKERYAVSYQVLTNIIQMAEGHLSNEREQIELAFMYGHFDGNNVSRTEYFERTYYIDR